MTSSMTSNCRLIHCQLLLLLLLLLLLQFWILVQLLQFWNMHLNKAFSHYNSYLFISWNICGLPIWNQAFRSQTTTLAGHHPLSLTWCFVKSCLNRFSVKLHNLLKLISTIAYNIWNWHCGFIVGDCSLAGKSRQTVRVRVRVSLFRKLVDTRSSWKHTKTVRKSLHASQHVNIP